MRTQEDKHTAKQLNILDTLPQGYEANIASKWEMIEMGMEPKKKRTPVYFMMAAAACLLLMVGAGYIFMKNGKKENSFAGLKKTEETKPLFKKVEPTITHQTNTAVAVEGNKKRTGLSKNKSITTVVVPIKQNSIDSASFVKQEAVHQQEAQQVGVQQNAAIDSTNNNVATNTIQTSPKKNKQRFYQMDFGEGSPNDIKQKTATGKLIQFKFSSKSANDGNQPSSKMAFPKIAQPL